MRVGYCPNMEYADRLVMEFCNRRSGSVSLIRCYGMSPSPFLSRERTSIGKSRTSEKCQNRTHALQLRRHGRAMAAMIRLATVDQLLRKALAVLDASGTAYGFNNLRGRNIMDKIS
jgi:hypothetical protein